MDRSQPLNLYSSFDFSTIIRGIGITRTHSCYNYFLQAITACAADPALLENEKLLLQNVMDTFPDFLATLPKAKMNLQYAVTIAWKRWLGCPVKRCPPCPIPYLQFIARIVEVQTIDAEMWEIRELLWREYKG